MTIAIIRGRTIEAAAVRDSFSRRATQYENKILLAFKNAGISPDSVDIPEERMPMSSSRNTPKTTTSWKKERKHARHWT